MKTKLVKSNFNEETHASYVKIQTKDGVFDALTFTHPDDYDIESKFKGCEWAERQATIKAMRCRLKTLRTRMEAYQGLVSYYKSKSEKVPREVWIFLNEATKQYEELKNQIAVSKEKLQTDIQEYREKVEKMRNSKGKRSNHIQWIDLGEIG